MVFLVGRNEILAQDADHQPQLWGEVDAAVGVVPLVIFLVGVVGQFVVFKAINPQVVVQVDAEEEFGPIDVVAQERLLVVRDEVAQEAVVVLVEIRDKVVVLIPAGEDAWIADLPVFAHGVGKFVLVVVVLD